MSPQDAWGSNDECDRRFRRRFETPEFWLVSFSFSSVAEHANYIIPVPFNNTSCHFSFILIFDFPIHGHPSMVWVVVVKHC